MNGWARRKEFPPRFAGEGRVGAFYLRAVAGALGTLSALAISTMGGSSTRASAGQLLATAIASSRFATSRIP